MLCGGFFSGLLETLLGKPGTLHSPGRIFTSALGVPPDLRGAPVLEGREGSTAGWRVLAASSPISWVEFAFVTRQGRSPCPNCGWIVLQLVYSSAFHLFSHVLSAA